LSGAKVSAYAPRRLCDIEHVVSPTATAVSVRQRTDTPIVLVYLYRLIAATNPH